MGRDAVVRQNERAGAPRVVWRTRQREGRDAVARRPPGGPRHAPPLGRGGAGRAPVSSDGARGGVPARRVGVAPRVAPGGGGGAVRRVRVGDGDGAVPVLLQSGRADARRAALRPHGPAGGRLRRTGTGSDREGRQRGRRGRLCQYLEGRRGTKTGRRRQEARDVSGGGHGQPRRERGGRGGCGTGVFLRRLRPGAVLRRARWTAGDDLLRGAEQRPAAAVLRLRRGRQQARRLRPAGARGVGPGRHGGGVGADDSGRTPRRAQTRESVGRRHRRHGRGGDAGRGGSRRHPGTPGAPVQRRRVGRRTGVGRGICGGGKRGAGAGDRRESGGGCRAAG
mmetsp:Transcript_39559/g.77301  ORF Transcript_39559/g.77301 Transcript_39559/m.77301 type:complete len:337 (+) Transcript_39559:474-1484(+)